MCSRQQIQKHQNQLQQDLSAANIQRARDKLEYMQRRASRSSDNIFSLNKETFATYVNAGPRPYHVFIVFQAREARNQCHMCPVIHQETLLLAMSYRTQHPDFYTSTSYNDSQIQSMLLNDHSIPVPVFFIEVEWGQNHDLFNLVKIQGAPTPVLVLHEISNVTPKIESFLSKHKRTSMRLTYDLNARSVNDWIAKWTQQPRVDLDRSSVSATDLAAYLFIAVFLVAIAYIYYTYLSTKIPRYVFLVISVLIYVWCVCGGL